MAKPSTQISETATTRIYGRLRVDILTGSLKPGEKLKIEELRRSYNVGSSPLREALSLLTSDGLVTRADQRIDRLACG